MASGKFLAAAAVAAGCVCLIAGSGKLFAQNTAMGQAEFYNPGSVSFTVPEGVTRIRVFVYGAGGGAGSSLSESQLGMNGGSGAFVQAVIDVTAGEKLTVVVGAGGKAGLSEEFKPGTAGGASQILNAGRSVLVSAGGGSPGTGPAKSSGTVHVGAGGVPGVAPPGSLLHPGPSGSDCGGEMTRCGYTPPGFTPDVSFGGRGFAGSLDGASETGNGNNGYVYLDW